MAPRTKIVVQPAKGGNIAKAVPGNSQLVVKKADGKIQLEHTYPRSSDPKRYRS